MLGCCGTAVHTTVSLPDISLSPSLSVSLSVVCVCVCVCGSVSVSVAVYVSLYVSNSVRLSVSVSLSLSPSLSSISHASSPQILLYFFACHDFHAQLLSVFLFCHLTTKHVLE